MAKDGNELSTNWKSEETEDMGFDSLQGTNIGLGDYDSSG